MVEATAPMIPATPTPQEVMGVGGEPSKDQEEQTSLLQKIADSNEKVADALSKKSSESIIIPA